jgi:hypothetical protein
VGKSDKKAKEMCDCTKRHTLGEKSTYMKSTYHVDTIADKFDYRKYKEYKK